MATTTSCCGAAEGLRRDPRHGHPHDYHGTLAHYAAGRACTSCNRPHPGQPAAVAQAGVHAFLTGRGRVFVEQIAGATAGVRFDCGDGVRSRVHEVPVAAIDFTREWAGVAR